MKLMSVSDCMGKCRQHLRQLSTSMHIMRNYLSEKTTPNWIYRPNEAGVLFEFYGTA
jgi:hypothetical protein